MLYRVNMWRAQRKAFALYRGSRKLYNRAKLEETFDAMSKEMKAGWTSLAYNLCYTISYTLLTRDETVKQAYMDARELSLDCWKSGAERLCQFVFDL